MAEKKKGQEEASRENHFSSGTTGRGEKREWREGCRMKQVEEITSRRVQLDGIKSGNDEKGGKGSKGRTALRGGDNWTGRKAAKKKREENEARTENHFSSGTTGNGLIRPFPVATRQVVQGLGRGHRKCPPPPSKILEEGALATPRLGHATHRFQARHLIYNIIYRR